MKKILALMSLVGLFQRGRAQSFDEWFEQNKTELKYLRQQLLALEEYDEVLAEGYAVDETGLTTIGGDKQQDLDLHTSYFATLSNVNPAIRGDARVDKILALTNETAKLITAIGALQEKFPRLTANLKAICSSLTAMSNSDLASLGNLLEDGEIQMHDSARLERLENLYEEAKKLNTTARGVFTNIKFFAI